MGDKLGGGSTVDRFLRVLREKTRTLEQESNLRMRTSEHWRQLTNDQHQQCELNMFRRHL